MESLLSSSTILPSLSTKVSMVRLPWVSCADAKLVTDRDGMPSARHTVVTMPENTQHCPYLTGRLVFQYLWRMSMLPCHLVG